ncbi:MAG: UDP-N-acetylmuramate--L-alanine ligase [Patescibacteria group bacterium]|nr:UDP-N-acetylmuramate--L-alanine ligase [Patescibacteria group bacterium]
MGIVEKTKKAHIIGIGGIGISAVAKLLLKSGIEVSGSDIATGDMIENLVNMGAEVRIGHDVANVPEGIDLVVRTDAVPDDNPELVEIRKRGVRNLTYFEFLGEYSKDKRTIAVSGTNGKSTTTAMLGMMLIEAGMDPTVIVGSKVPSFPDGNLRLGQSDLLVVEACEHHANMLKFHPFMAVITNIEEEHLDFYRDRKHIVETFQEFLGQVGKGGSVVLNADDSACADELRTDGKKVTYGSENDADYKVTAIICENGRQEFEMDCRGERSCRFTLRVPGRFNVHNAAAAITAAAELGASEDAIHKALDAYTGIWRRFEVIGEHDGALIISDYGHHPTAVASTLQAAREFYPDRQIILVFQPHHHSRTKKLFNRFVLAMDGADTVIIPEIFDVAGREKAEDGAVSSGDLRDAVAARDKERGVERHVSDTGSVDAAYEETVNLMRPGDIVLVMGAGDVYKIAYRLVGREE